MIGIICAMKIEADAIRASLTDTSTETVSGIEFTTGALHGKKIVIAVCGIGILVLGFANTWFVSLLTSMIQGVA